MSYRGMGQTALPDETAQQICQTALMGTWNGATRECGEPYMNEPLIQTGCAQIGGIWNGDRKVCVFPDALPAAPPGIPGYPGVPIPGVPIPGLPNPASPPPTPPPDKEAGLNIPMVALYGGAVLAVWYIFIRKPTK